VISALEICMMLLAERTEKSIDLLRDGGITFDVVCFPNLPTQESFIYFNNIQFLLFPDNWE
jgi:hypothetical protein